jgi:transcriptional regulator with XRE-family HTH domain
MGGRIRQLRGDESQIEFARRLGITREQLSRIESGSQPRTATLRRLAQVTGQSLDFIILGIPGPPRDPAAGGRWDTALQPLLAGTGLSLDHASTAAARRAARAWPELTEERKDDVRSLVRQIALIAVALQTALPPKAAKPVTEALGAALAAAVADLIVAAHGRPVS